MKSIYNPTFSAVLLAIIRLPSSNAFGMFGLRPQSTGGLHMTATAQETQSTGSTTKKTVKFSKYEGLGNDFVLVDDRTSLEPSLTPEESVRLCNRNFGIGGDGVIFALKPKDPSTYDFAMRIYNSDGSEPEMVRIFSNLIFFPLGILESSQYYLHSLFRQCGNGIRCLAQFLKDLGEAPPNSSYNIDTLAGTIVPVVNDETGMITVDMGSPILDGPTVPCLLEPNFEGNSIVEQTLEAPNGKSWKVSAVSMGNPHAIIFVDDLEADVSLEQDGSAIETFLEAFPQKTNVEFVQVLSDNHLKMKVWERGAGPTLACGTGTCALVVAAIRANKIPRPTGEDGTEASQVKVTLPGGDLFIEWRESNNKVYMTGPGTRVFSGTIEL